MNMPVRNVPDADSRFRLPCNEHLVDRAYDVANVISELDDQRAIIRRVEIGQHCTTLYLARQPVLHGITPHLVSLQEAGPAVRVQRARYRNCQLEWPL